MSDAVGWGTACALFIGSVLGCATPPRPRPPPTGDCAFYGVDGGCELLGVDAGDEDYCARANSPMTIEERQVLCGPKQIDRDGGR